MSQTLTPAVESDSVSSESFVDSDRTIPSISSVSPPVTIESSSSSTSVDIPFSSASTTTTSSQTSASTSSPSSAISLNHIPAVLQVLYQPELNRAIMDSLRRREIMTVMRVDRRCLALVSGQIYGQIDAVMAKYMKNIQSQLIHPYREDVVDLDITPKTLLHPFGATDPTIMLPPLHLRRKEPRRFDPLAFEVQDSLRTFPNLRSITMSQLEIPDDESYIVHLAIDLTSCTGRRKIIAVDLHRVIDFDVNTLPFLAPLLPVSPTFRGISTRQTYTLRLGQSEWEGTQEELKSHRKKWVDYLHGSTLDGRVTFIDSFNLGNPLERAWVTSSLNAAIRIHTDRKIHGYTFWRGYMMDGAHGTLAQILRLFDLLGRKIKLLRVDNVLISLVGSFEELVQLIDIHFPLLETLYVSIENGQLSEHHPLPPSLPRLKCFTYLGESDQPIPVSYLASLGSRFCVFQSVRYTSKKIANKEQAQILRIKHALSL